MVHRFDFENDGVTRKGMEDLCSLLSLRPEEKYQSTWERVVGRIKDVVTVAAQRNAALSQLADLLLLTDALRNAGCHTKNIALLYASRESIALAPVYDMLTITAYDDYAKSPPGMPGGAQQLDAGKGIGAVSADAVRRDARADQGARGAHLRGDRSRDAEGG